jgi:hypothetical protein
MGSGRRPPGSPWAAATDTAGAASNPSKNAKIMSLFTSLSVADAMDVCKATGPC